MRLRIWIQMLVVVVLAASLCGVASAYGPTKVMPGKALVGAHKAKKKIGVQRANAIATKKYHGKVVGKTKLENEEGKLEYAVMVRTGKKLREVMVDAFSGKIASAEIVTARKEKAEEKAKSKKHKPLGKAK